MHLKGHSRVLIGSAKITPMQHNLLILIWLQHGSFAGTAVVWGLRLWGVDVGRGPICGRGRSPK